MKNKKLEKWLEETKAKNLSKNELYEFISLDSNCSIDLYLSLKEKFNLNNQNQLTDYLFNQWQKEAEFSPKIIGYKAPFDLVGGAVKKGDIYKFQCINQKHGNKEYSREGQYIDGHALPQEIVETWESVYEELPTETDFKSQVIELIEENINDKQQKLKFVIDKNNLIYEAVLECIVAIQKDLLEKIKQIK